MKSVGADAASMVAYNDYYGRLDPSPPALERIPIGMVLPNERLVNRDLMTRGEFFNDWANPNNVNNSSSVAGTCTYDATAPNSLIPPFHRDFTIAANGGASFQIMAIPTGTQYNTVTVCRGNFQGKDVEIGRVQLTKTF